MVMNIGTQGHEPGLEAKDYTVISARTNPSPFSDVPDWEKFDRITDFRPSDVPVNIGTTLKTKLQIAAAYVLAIAIVVLCEYLAR